MKLTSKADFERYFTYCHDTGRLLWRPDVPAHKTARHTRGKYAGNKNRQGYLYFGFMKNCYLAHRVVWTMFNDETPNKIDHINGDKSDNRIENLRNVDSNGNSQNQRKAQSNNKCGVLGVCWNNQRKGWQASIGVNSKLINLGIFKTIDEAGAAYIEAKRKYHSTCTI